MLRYKLNIKDKTQKLIEVKYDSLYLSKDASYLTGITDPSYCLSEEDSIMVISNETQICSLEAENVMCCGYVIYNKKYTVEHFENTVGILYEDGQYYCIDRDFSIKQHSKISSSVLGVVDSINTNPKITIDNKEYEIGRINNGSVEWYEEIVIPTKYWSFDNKITIDNIVYDVIIETKNTLTNNENYYPYIILNDSKLKDIDRILYVIDWEYSKRHLITRFKITSNTKTYLHLTESVCVKQCSYFDEDVIGMGTIRHYESDFNTQDDFLREMFRLQKTPLTEWKKTSESNVVDFFVKENVGNLLDTCQIHIKPLGVKLSLKSEVKTSSDIIFNYYGKKYVCDSNLKKKYLVINNNEYEIFSSVKWDSKTEQFVFNNNYIIFENNPLTIITSNTNGNETAKIHLPSFFDSEEYFDIKTYNYIEIEGVTYKVYKIGNDNIYGVDIYNIPTIPLQIINRFGNNVIRCIPYNTNDTLNVLFRDISSNPSNFRVEVVNPLFDVTLIKPLTKEDKDYITSELKLFVNHSSFVIPIKLEADTALNLHKDYLISKNYLEGIKEELIPRIVDMEKDVYYPAYFERKGSKDILTLCHTLQIDLHFRTRDLETWVVNDENNVNEYGGLYSSNWNLFDSYRYPIDNTINKSFQPKLELKGDLQFYPPSDLIYFLNFTDDDVFYQKQKIGKSFLRISFYDSPDPNNQSLLYSSTVFMSETELYKKYVNADKTLTHYVTIKERGTSKEKHISKNNDYNHTTKIINYILDNNNRAKHISVSTEPCKSNVNQSLTFDENKRLSSSFIIKNRNECVDSSEGFYLYLFKEYSNWTHERSIYMRVQFNHAGMGRTVNFMLLYHKNNVGKKSMINWSSKFNFDKYKDGCPLNELYEHIFIEIKVKYDLENKRFCYYLPEWMSEKNSDKHTMRLSLFEIKIKDESK